MKCKNCGAELEKDVRFCNECGEKVVVEDKKIKKVEDIKAELKEELKEELKKELKQEKKYNFNMDIVGFLKGALLTPVKSMDENTKKLNNPKNVCIFAGILALVMTALNFLRALFASFWVKEWNFKEFRMVTKFDLGGALKLDYVDLLLKQLLIYALFVFLIAGVFYIGTLIFKKKADFIKILGVTSVSLIPNVVLSMVIAPILQMLHWSLYSIVNTVASLSLLFILYEVMDRELSFKSKDKKVWFYVICFSILYAVKLLFMYL